MGVVQEKGIYLFEELQDFGVIAGFTDASFSGIAVKKDIKRIASCLDFTYDYVAYLSQVHSNRVVYPCAQKLPKADGLITDKRQIALVVRTADCLPLFFYDYRRFRIENNH